MKMNKKKTFVLAVLVLLIALISTSSLAWFSASDKVNNEFMVAGSESGNADDIFSIDVWERRDVDGDGTYEDANEHTGLKYDDILPGDQLSKEVYIKNTGAYDQYVRVTVTISDAEAWVKFAEANPNFQVTEVFGGYDASQWVHVWNNLNGATTLPENIVYVMYYKNVLGKGQQINLFNSINIPTALTQAQAAEFEGGFTVNVVADAVQTENVGAENVAAEDAAWTAFKTVTES